MEEKLNHLVNTLEENVMSDDFIDVCYDVTNELEDIDESNRAIDLILRLMEKYPYADFGTPGPLVHFVEKFYLKGYEEKLIESIERCPTRHTIWMLNRILNALPDDEKIKYLKILVDIAESSTIDKEIKGLAKEFINVHRG